MFLALSKLYANCYDFHICSLSFFWLHLGFSLNFSQILPHVRLLGFHQALEAPRKCFTSLIGNGLWFSSFNSSGFESYWRIDPTGLYLVGFFVCGGKLHTPLWESSVKLQTGFIVGCFVFTPTKKVPLKTLRKQTTLMLFIVNCPDLIHGINTIEMVSRPGRSTTSHIVAIRR